MPAAAKRPSSGLPGMAPWWESDERGRDAPCVGVERTRGRGQSPASVLEAKARVERKASPPDLFLRKPGCEAFSSANPMLGWSAPLRTVPPPDERFSLFQSAPDLLSVRPRTPRRLPAAVQAEDGGGTQAGERMYRRAMQSEAAAYTAGVAARAADDTRLTRSPPESDGQPASRRVPSARTTSSSSSLAAPPPRSARTPTPQAARAADDTRLTRSRRALPESDGQPASRRVPSARTTSSSSSLAAPPPRSARTPTPQPGASSRASGPAPTMHSADRSARKVREARTPDRRPGDEYARRRRTVSREEEPQRVTPSPWQPETRRQEIAKVTFALDRRPGEDYARRCGTARRTEEPQRARVDLALMSPCETLVIDSVPWALGLLMLLFLLVFIFLCIWD